MSVGPPECAPAIDGEGHRQTKAPLWKVEKRKTLWPRVLGKKHPCRVALRHPAHRRNEKEAPARAPISTTQGPLDIKPLPVTVNRGDCGLRGRFSRRGEVRDDRDRGLF